MTVQIVGVHAHFAAGRADHRHAPDASSDVDVP
jgi:hypothetical protein